MQHAESCHQRTSTEEHLSNEDSTLLELKSYIVTVSNRWMDKQSVTLQAYKHLFAKLTGVDGVVMRREQIVVPNRLRTRMLEIAHKGHQGQVRTKWLLSAHLWFLDMDKHYEKFISTCINFIAKQSHRKTIMNCQK